MSSIGGKGILFECIDAELADVANHGLPFARVLQGDVVSTMNGHIMQHRFASVSITSVDQYQRADKLIEMCRAMPQSDYDPIWKQSLSNLSLRIRVSLHTRAMAMNRPDITFWEMFMRISASGVALVKIDSQQPRMKTPATLAQHGKWILCQIIVLVECLDGSWAGTLRMRDWSVVSIGFEISQMSMNSFRFGVPDNEHWPSGLPVFPLQPIQQVTACAAAHPEAQDAAIRTVIDIL